MVKCHAFSLYYNMKLQEISNVPGTWVFYCPGCKQVHQIISSGEGRPNWDFNGNKEFPTFRPSLLVRGGHHDPNHKGPECWCTYNEKNKEKPAPFSCNRCHSFITDGKIQFLDDCSHELRGKTVDIPEWKDENW